MQRLQIGFVHLTAPMLSTAFGHETDVELIIWQWKYVSFIFFLAWQTIFNQLAYGVIP